MQDRQYVELLLPLSRPSIQLSPCPSASGEWLNPSHCRSSACESVRGRNLFSRRRCWVSRDEYYFRTYVAAAAAISWTPEQSPRKLGHAVVSFLPPLPPVSSLPDNPSSALAFYTTLTLFRPLSTPLIHKVPVPDLSRMHQLPCSKALTITKAIQMR